MPEAVPILSWLLEDDNPGVRVRALTGLCEYPQDHREVMASRCLVLQTLPAARDLSWMEMKGQSLTYHLTALAESGLTCEDIPLETAVDKVLSQPFDANCGELMAFRALVVLGYGHDPRIGECLAKLQEVQLPTVWVALPNALPARPRVPWSRSFLLARRKATLFAQKRSIAHLSLLSMGCMRCIGRYPAGIRWSTGPLANMPCSLSARYTTPRSR
jgi:hypothetical protein